VGDFSAPTSDSVMHASEASNCLLYALKETRIDTTTIAATADQTVLTIRAALRSSPIASFCVTLNWAPQGQGKRGLGQDEGTILF
jgi:hypothetical protein